ncbi:MAG TPA: PLP-dependent aminotransferase family protein [Rariglobus sp.]|jgi:2-aminoadipate transaminase|nr:PLP-dependent aminotransferase family protein [Rariglobus sp.]
MSDPSSCFSLLGERARPPTIARLMTLMLENPSLLSLAAGFTDNRTLPVDAVQAAVAALAGQPGEPQYLQYGSNQGRPGLRALLADRLIEQEPELKSQAAAIKDGFFITNGSQQALYVAMQVLCDPGDIVLVDRPSYFVYLEMLSGLGAQARSLPLNEEGRIDGPALRSLLAGMRTRGELPRLKAVYFVSYFSNPSARSLDESEKNAVADALTAEGVVVPVVEDAAYRELYFETPHPARSVLSLPAWKDFPKLYVSTLTKPFASGLKVGYGTCTDASLLAKMMYVRGHHDFGTTNFNQAILEQVLATGGLDRQLAIIRPAYLKKMNVLHAALTDAGLPELGWRWQVPEGGLYLWLEAPAAFDAGLDSPFCRACVEAGVLYVPGELCFGDDIPKNFVRLSFGVLGEKDLAEAGRRFVEVAGRFR